MSWSCGLASDQSVVFDREFSCVFIGQELTGAVPSDFPLEPGEKPPCVRRRGGASQGNRKCKAEVSSSCVCLPDTNKSACRWCLSVACGLWSVIWDLWSVICGLWPMDCGLCSVTCSLWSVICNLWSVVCGFGLWSMVCHVWSVVCGLCVVVCLVWVSVCGLWSVVKPLSQVKFNSTSD